MGAYFLEQEGEIVTGHAVPVALDLQLDGEAATGGVGEHEAGPGPGVEGADVSGHA